MKTILVVEDDSTILKVMSSFLKQAGYSVTTASDGLKGYETFQAGKFDLVIMDVMMPKMDGYTLTELVRLRHNTPILMITALGEENDELKGFDLGADDYLQKPFSYQILLKRVEALLRRSAPQDTDEKTLECGDIFLDRERFIVLSKGKKVTLTKKEFDLLELLLRNKNRVISREIMLEQVWDYMAIVDTNIINTHMKNLRQKLGTDKILTIRGAGYKIVD
ncbi:response regulator transcription factor [Listeria costaricensis]|uniref:response regulator transcription factor n=1 Tax=Listeria costaricensis TaxID=2026604 RepID=UPI000C06DE4C|nr:response regulator transcription factor [Listeria costaricensis]